MKYVGSILFYRLLFLVFNFLIIYKIYIQIFDEYTAYQELKESSVPVFRIPWSSVDVENPPFLNDSRLERMRLNELLAVPQYNCKRPRIVGDSSDSFTVCNELGDIKSALTVTGDTFSSGAFESQLNVSKWTVFLPEENKLVDHLQGDVEVNYMTELPQWRHWHTWDFEQTVKNQSYGVAKFDLYTSQFESFDQTEVIKKLVELMTTEHLLLYIRVGAADDESFTTVIAEWYRLLYWLVYQKDFALVAARPGGNCGNPPHICRYRVSLARTGLTAMKSAPVFGMGSPSEEKKRLLKSIEMDKSLCTPSSSVNFPKYCLQQLHKESVVVVISYSDKFLVPTELSISENLFIISPTIKKAGETQLLGYGVSIGNSFVKTIDTWKLEKLETLLETVSGNTEIDLLILDLEGGEWDVFDDVLMVMEKLSIRQLAIRGRLWIEENENYRSFYWKMQKLIARNYMKMFGVLNMPNFDIAFMRRN